MGKFLNAVTEQMNIQSAQEGERIGSSFISYSEKSSAELSAKAKEDFQKKDMEEQSAWMRENGILGDGTENLEKYLDAVSSGKPVICLQIGTTGLNKQKKTDAYDENGKFIGKEEPFREHVCTQVGVVVFAPNEEGKYVEQEKYLGVLENVPQKAIDACERSEFFSKCEKYNSVKPMRSDGTIVPINMWTEKGYNAIREGGFGVSVENGGLGFSFENRKMSPLCKDGEQITKDIADIYAKYPDALVVTNMDDTKGWLNRSGVYIPEEPLGFRKVTQEYIRNSEYGKANPLVGTDGNVISTATLKTIVAECGIDNKMMRADDKAQAIGTVLNIILDKINLCKEFERQEIREEIAEKQKELEAVKDVAPEKADALNIEPAKAEPIKEAVNEKEQWEIMYNDGTLTEKNMTQEQYEYLDGKFDLKGEKWEDVVGKTDEEIAELDKKTEPIRTEPIGEPVIVAPEKPVNKAQEVVNDVDEKSSLEQLGALGDMGMSVADKNASKEEKVGMFFDAKVKADIFVTGNDKKALYTAMTQMASDVALHCKDIIGVSIKMNEVNYSLDDDGYAGIGVSFVGIPADKVEDVKLFLIENFNESTDFVKALKRNNFEYSPTVETALIPVVAFGDAKSYDRTLDFTAEPSMEMRVKEIDRYVDFLGELSDSRAVQIAENEVDTPKADIGIAQAVETLLTAIQKPLMDKVDEQSRELSVLKEQNRELLEKVNVLIEKADALEQSNKELFKQNEELLGKNDVLKSLVEEGVRSQAILLSKMVERESKETPKDKFVETTRTNKGIGNA